MVVEKYKIKSQRRIPIPLNTHNQDKFKKIIDKINDHTDDRDVIKERKYLVQDTSLFLFISFKSPFEDDDVNFESACRQNPRNMV